MSTPSSGRRGPFRKPRLDIYTVMLALALVAVILGCICLYLEVADYGDQRYQLGLSVPLELDRPAPSAVARCCGPRGPCDLCLADCWKAPVHG